ncbi:3-deoxy-7-phosphoheptulonate synthase [Carboxydothermus islandicus]|uniref:3-deoxy-7-phosphoheptulonate synthase n=1 Tax=Carboxydothermus islandicus TaxID=661089 RepID=A0A1L8D124_9THEO|nr:3-deoxy-7-phosphoheptulonate synthase [Carboxydothermus islandicus]GAV24895.1 3-deoxy-7-phosphoheptulonate synthase [Carboxydothermus islandicus]
MIVVFKKSATREQIEAVREKLIASGFTPHLSEGVERTIIGIIGDKRNLADLNLELMPGVDTLVPILKPYKLASKEFREKTEINVKGESIGSGNFTIIAGPCAVENRESLKAVAQFLKDKGIKFLRGGTFKPRTSPYSFQGLGEEGVLILQEIGQEYGLITVTEVLEAKDVEFVAEKIDILQVGARNMQNFALLKELSQVENPVILKRGLSATIEEWLLAAEYLLAGGNQKVILCERGIRTFETATRNTLDLSAVALVKQLSHLPVIVDPSHATGKRELILPLSRAALALGADGLMIEVHPEPEKALSDGPQSLNFSEFSKLFTELNSLFQVLEGFK